MGIRINIFSSGNHLFSLVLHFIKHGTENKNKLIKDTKMKQNLPEKIQAYASQVLVNFSWYFWYGFFNWPQPALKMDPNMVK